MEEEERERQGMTGRDILKPLMDTKRGRRKASMEERMSKWVEAEK